MWCAPRVVDLGIVRRCIVWKLGFDDPRDRILIDRGDELLLQPKIRGGGCQEIMRHISGDCSRIAMWNGAIVNIRVGREQAVVAPDRHAIGAPIDRIAPSAADSPGYHLPCPWWSSAPARIFPLAYG